MSSISGEYHDLCYVGVVSQKVRGNKYPSQGSSHFGVTY